MPRMLKRETKTCVERDVPEKKGTHKGTLVDRADATYLQGELPMRIPILSASRRRTTGKDHPSTIEAAVEIARICSKQVEKPVELVYTHGAVAETTAIMSEDGILLGIKRGKADYFGTAWFEEHEVGSVTDAETGKVLFPFK